jgi:hypothetical protein
MRKPKAAEHEMIAAAREMLYPPARDEVKAARAAARSGAIVNLNDLRDADPEHPYETAAAIGIDPRDLHDTAVGLVSACMENNDMELWEAFAPNIRKVVLAVLRLDPPKQKGRRSNLMKKRQIVGVVKAICGQYGLNPTRNPLSEGVHTGCSIVAAVEGKSERYIERIYGENNP